MPRPISEQEYFNLTLSKTPEVKRGEQHTLKKDENIWTIAREKLGKNASKSELLDYTYKVAKLNGYKSLDEMNSLKVNEKIYLPDMGKPASAEQSDKPVVSKKPESKAPRTEVTKPTKTQARTSTSQTNEFIPVFSWQEQGSFLLDNFKKQHEVKVPFAPADQVTKTSKKAPVVKAEAEKPREQKLTFPKGRNTAEEAFYNIAKTIIENPERKKFLLSPKNNNLTNSPQNYDTYYIDIPDNNNENKISFFLKVNEEGKITKMSYNALVDENSGCYDFDITPDGKITAPDKVTGAFHSDVSSVDKKYFNKLEEYCLKMINSGHREILPEELNPIVPEDEILDAIEGEPIRPFSFDSFVSDVQDFVSGIFSKIKSFI